jgi:hypothetical protein
MPIKAFASETRPLRGCCFCGNREWQLGKSLVAIMAAQNQGDHGHKDPTLAMNASECIAVLEHISDSEPEAQVLSEQAEFGRFLILKHVIRELRKATGVPAPERSDDDDDGSTMAEFAPTDATCSDFSSPILARLYERFISMLMCSNERDRIAANDLRRSEGIEKALEFISCCELVVEQPPDVPNTAGTPANATFSASAKARAFRAIERQFEAKPFEDVVGYLRACMYTVTENLGAGADGDQYSVGHGWTEKGVRHFAAVVKFMDPIICGAGDIEQREQGGDA